MVIKALRAAAKQAAGGEELLLDQRGLLADAVAVAANDDFAVAGPLLGSPAAAACCELLYSAKVRRIILLGLAGGLAADNCRIAVGDLILPRGCLSEEGTSGLYGAKHEWEMLPGRLQQQLETELAAAPVQPALHRGFVWTTDAPYRESPAKVEKFRSRGAIAVEMELAAVSAVCRYRKIELAALFVTSDILTDSWQGAFGAASRSTGLQSAAAAAVRTAVTREK